MAEARATKVRSIELGVRDLDTSVKFYTDCWGLQPVARDGGAIYLRATGADHHALVLHRSDKIGLLSANFAAEDKASVDALYGRAMANGIEVVRAPQERAAIAGGGYGFSCRLPEGEEISISSDVREHVTALDDKTRPNKFSHVVFRTERCEETEAFFRDFLGFKVSDRTDNIHFLRCASDHHSVALARVAGPGLHHMAFELPDLDSLMRASGRLKRHGFEVEHGVGRHAGPGDNIFSFFVDPNGFAAEYTTEMEQVDDSYPERSKDYWRSVPSRPCSWGMAMVESDYIKKAKAGLVTSELNQSCSEVISERLAV